MRPMLTLAVPATVRLPPTLSTSLRPAPGVSERSMLTAEPLLRERSLLNERVEAVDPRPTLMCDPVWATTLPVTVAPVAPPPSIPPPLTRFSVGRLEASVPVSGSTNVGVPVMVVAPRLIVLPAIRAEFERLPPFRLIVVIGDAELPIL